MDRCLEVLDEASEAIAVNDKEAVARRLGVLDDYIEGPESGVFEILCLSACWITESRGRCTRRSLNGSVGWTLTGVDCPRILASPS